MLLALFLCGQHLLHNMGCCWAGALSSMQQSSAEAARILKEHGATACTDVTGFGLVGHLVEMTRPSQAPCTPTVYSLQALLQLSCTLTDNSFVCASADEAPAFCFVSASLERFQQMAHSPSADAPVHFIFLSCHGDLHQSCTSSWCHHTSAAVAASK